MADQPNLRSSTAPRLDQISARQRLYPGTLFGKEAMRLTTNPSYDFDSSPEEWKSADEPITEAQREYLSDLAAKAREPISEEELDALTKAEASERIDDLLQ
jgi:hypothetical protein